jgi:Tfp pilus assembly protein PilO
MALGEKAKKQVMYLVTALPVLAAVAYYMLMFQPDSDRLGAMRSAIDTMNIKIESAKADLAKGTVEGARARVNAYLNQLTLLRKLVPAANDVPNLIDDISNRAKRRGVQIAKFTPGAVDQVPPFEVHKYAYTVFGHYDEVAGFLSDVASLQRIMVPYDLKIDQAKQVAMKAYADTSGGLLEVSFELRTFVKVGADSGSASGTSGQ